MWGGVCPNCDRQECDLLSTENEWSSHCTRCDIRFNKHGQVRPGDLGKLSPGDYTIVSYPDGRQVCGVIKHGVLRELPPGATVVLP